MNVQVQYLGMFAANLVEFAEPIIRTVNNNLHYLEAYQPAPDAGLSTARKATIDLTVADHSEFLGLPRKTIDDIPDDYLAARPLDEGILRKAEKGDFNGERMTNIGWLLHDYYQYYRMNMDRETAKDLFKLLKLSMRGFLYMLGEKREDGFYHLTEMYSPEIGGSHGENANYGLSVIRWECRALLELDSRWGFQDPERDTWRDILDNLIPYPSGSNGYLLNNHLGPSNHRHWSHLLMIYPLRIVDWYNPEERDIIKKSVDHWVELGMQKRAWSIAAGAAMYAGMKDGNTALKLLRRGAWSEDVQVQSLRENTSWKNLVETPQMFVRAIQELSLQSWGNTIHVLPAVPEEWDNAAFHNMRAQGNFSISAIRRDGETRFIHISSHSGEPCRIRTDMPQPIRATGTRAFSLTELEENVFEIDLKKGESALLHTEGQNPTVQIDPLASDGWHNWWGNRRKHKDDIVATKAKVSSRMHWMGWISGNAGSGVWFDLEKTSRVHAAVHDLRGRLVHTLADRVLSEGRHRLFWGGGGYGRKTSGSGSYIVSLTVGKKTYARRIIMPVGEW